MYRIRLTLGTLLAVAGVVAGAAPAVEDVQGLYEGARTDAKGPHKIEARVVALAGGVYQMLIREPAAEGKVVKHKLEGKTDRDVVTFTGEGLLGDCAARYADGKITCHCRQNGKLDLKRVVRMSPTMGAKPPAGAIVLLDGKSFDELDRKAGKDGKLPEWKRTGDGGIVVPKGGLRTKRSFAGSFKLHVEFKSPLMPEKKSQGRGNSGCFLPNGNEVQVLDSFGMTTYKGGGCGGLYRFKDPDAFDEFSLASAPPGQWQTYDITYEVEVKDGKPTGKPALTVLHNGIKIHDKFRLPRNARAGKLSFQDHRDAVQYRNIWILETK